MNSNSIICRELDFIQSEIGSNDTNDMIDKFREKYPAIKIKRLFNLGIFNYAIGADFTDPVICEARGIIIDLFKLDVVCWPFRKFGRYDEPYADKIDWSTAKVQEKIDGSIIKVWWNRTISSWIFSSNSMIFASDAKMNDAGLSLMDIIKRSAEYENLMSWLARHGDKYLTYILELVSPDNRVVVPYDETHLYQTGCRDNATGQEYPPTIPVLEKPKMFSLKSLPDCIKSLNPSTGIIDKVDAEGYVVVDAHWNRIKIKSPEYMIIHHLVSITKESMKTLVELLWNHKISIQSMCKNYPNLAHILKYYDYQVTDILHNMKSMIDVSRKAYHALNYDRRALANIIKKDDYAPIGFSAIGNLNLPEDEIIDQYGIQFIMKRIKPYETGRFSYIFEEVYKEG